MAAIYILLFYGAKSKVILKLSKEAIFHYLSEATTEALGNKSGRCKNTLL